MPETVHGALRYVTTATARRLTRVVLDDENRFRATAIRRRTINTYGIHADARMYDFRVSDR